MTAKNFHDLIAYENEHSGVDFKMKPYAKQGFADMLKDVMSMANADIPGERYIVFGVKLKVDGTREFHAISDAMLDPATYEQTIRGNIEPEIPVQIHFTEHNGTRLAVLVIEDCLNGPYLNGPYMMRKDFRALKHGDAYVRKGSHQHRMTRQDFERFINSSGEIADQAIKITAQDGGNIIELGALPPDYQTPSSSDVERIKGILAARENAPLTTTPSQMFQKHLLAPSAMTPFVGENLPYEQRSSADLRELLALREKQSTSEPSDEDLYDLYELHANKVNLLLENNGDRYIEDATIRLRIPITDILKFVRKPISPPQRGFGFAMARLDTTFMNYPSVTSHDDRTEITESLGNLRHLVPVDAFETPLRVVAFKGTEGREISFEVELLGHNLRRPIKRTLGFRITPFKGITELDEEGE